MKKKLPLYFNPSSQLESQHITEMIFILWNGN